MVHFKRRKLPYVVLILDILFIENIHSEAFLSAMIVGLCQFQFDPRCVQANIVALKHKYQKSKSKSGESQLSVEKLKN